MADPLRRIAGFTELSLGVNGGVGPTLLPPNQCAMAVNVTFRGDFPETRPSWINHIMLGTPATWTGLFQGSFHYDGGMFGQSGWLIARGGHFFFLTDDNFTMSEVTPQLPIVTTADFTLPGAGNQVLVNLNGNPPVTVGTTVMFGAIHYTVVSLFTNQIRLTQVDAGAGTVTAGSSLLDNSGKVIIQFQTYPPTLNFVFMFQAENFGIILGGQEHTLIWNGQTLRQSSINEVPSGFVGAYGWGRIWLCRPDRRTFIAGNLAFDPAGGGTPQSNFRDSILKFTDNDIINEGGSFGVPYEAGLITAMQFLASQDSSLGVGPLLVSTPNLIFSVNAPVDRTTWKNLTYPIQTIALIDYGPRSPRATVSVNGDMWYRSEDGFRSFIVARRNFPQPGNTPMSHELDPILNVDDNALLFFGSAILFDNKLFSTVSPFTQNGQVLHRGVVPLNFDLISSLRGRQSPCWEGPQTGLNIIQLTKARIADNERAFMWVMGSDVELWEILQDGISDEFSVSSNGITVARQPIGSLIQTRAEDYGVPLELKRLIMAELYIEDIADMVNFSLLYKPDEYCNWFPWISFPVCATATQCDVTTLKCTLQANARGYAARLTIPQPPAACNPMTNRPASEFHDCQFMLMWNGHCRIRRFFTHVKIQTQPMEGICPPALSCLMFPCCDQNLFTYNSHPAIQGIGILGEGAGENILSEGGGFILGE